MLLTKKIKPSSQVNTLTTHHMYDGYQGNPQLLDDINVVSGYAQELHLYPLDSYKFSLHYHDGPEDMHGVTSILLSPGAHTTVHTYSFPTKKCSFVDVYNAHHSSQELATLSQEYFGFLDYTSYTNLRGTLSNSSKTHSLNYLDKESYGPHLILEGKCPKNYHIDRSLLEYTVKELAQKIKMTPIHGPVSIQDDYFLSAILVIAESHIAVHFSKSTRQIYLDIFSCKYFDLNYTIRFLNKHLLNNYSKIKLFKRGQGFYD